jgi:hypothetical protein
MNDRTVRITAGGNPPEIIEYAGRKYRPTWRETTTDSDIRRGEQVFVVLAMGHPLDDETGQESEE